MSFVRQLVRYCSTKSYVELNISEKCAILSLNRPEAKNALNLAVIKSLQQRVSEVAKCSSDVRVLMLRSLVPRVFCAGADLKERLSMRSQREINGFLMEFRHVIEQIYDLPIPTICCFDGLAFGGGFELGLACDLRFASLDSRFGLVETRLGIIPGAGGTQTLPRIASPNLAKEFIFTGRIFNGSQMKNVLNGVFEQNDTGDAAYVHGLSVAKEIQDHTAPESVKMAKKAINCGLNVDLKSGLLIEQACYHQLLDTNDRVEGLKAFSEKRKPRFQGN